MKKPNFFILGAPKCGTTSLAAWLSEHPHIYMSPVKEPHFFNDDSTYNATSSIEQYEKFFSAVTASHLAIGEASVWYLYSSSAVPNIERYSPRARYIVCLRNPVEMAISLHEQSVVSGFEHINNFEDAWSLNENRLNGESVTRLCLEPRNLAYNYACRIGDQLERLLTRVDSRRVRVVLLDDIKEDPKQEYGKTLSFLGVDDDNRSDFSVHNSAKELRSRFFRKSVLATGQLKRRLGINIGFGLLNRLNNANIRHRPREPISPAVRNQLELYFRADIEKLARILDRDLSHWLVS